MARMIGLIFAKVGPTALVALLAVSSIPPPIISDAAGIALVWFVPGAGVTYPRGSGQLTLRILLSVVASIAIVMVATAIVVAYPGMFGPERLAQAILLVSAPASVVGLFGWRSQLGVAHRQEWLLIASALLVSLLMRAVVGKP